MEQVTALLLEAHQLEPYRTDLLVSAANAQIYNGNVDRAIALFEQALTAARTIWTSTPIWPPGSASRATRSKSDGYLKRVGELNAGRAADLQRLFATVDRVVATPSRSVRDGREEGRRAIVTLGYALNPDGSMHEILLGRLETTAPWPRPIRRPSSSSPAACPRTARPRGKLMADWLAKKGIDRSRIIEENYATSTVENALYSGYALARHEIEFATLVSSASHVRRGQTLLEIACWQSGPANIRIDSVAYPDKPLSALAKASPEELLGIYRDALRTYGLWSYRSAPLVER